MHKQRVRVSSRAALLFAVHLLGLLSLACPFDRSGDSNMRPIGPEVRASLVLYFKKDVTRDQTIAFYDEVLSRPDPEGRGHDHPPGVQSTLLVSTQGHEGYALTFFPNATEEQRRSLRDAIKASPLVYKVFENVSPADIKILD